MKRKDFLRKMRERRRGGAPIEEREPGRRRAIDWRTVRVDLPEADAEADPMTLPVGRMELLPDGIELAAEEACWVRGYRLWEEDGTRRAEFQYRPVEGDRDPPPGATALRSGDTWTP